MSRKPNFSQSESKSTGKSTKNRKKSSNLSTTTQTQPSNIKNTESQNIESTLHKYYHRAVTTFSYSSDICFYTDSFNSLLSQDFYPNGHILSPRLRSPLSEKAANQLATKIMSLLDKSKIIGVESFDGEAEAYFNNQMAGSQTQMSNTASNKHLVCYVDSINLLIDCLLKRMPKQLRIYRQDFELSKREVWRTNSNNSSIGSKLLPIEISRVSPQSFVIFSKIDLEILEPWKVAITKSNKSRKNKNKGKDKNTGEHKQLDKDESGSVDESRGQKIELEEKSDKEHDGQTGHTNTSTN